MPRLSFPALALTCLLVAAATTANASDGVAASDGSGADEATACQAAKAAANLAVGSALQLQGSAAHFRITGFSACMCSRRPDADDNLAMKMVAWNCTVNVEYELTGD